MVILLASYVLGKYSSEDFDLTADIFLGVIVSGEVYFNTQLLIQGISNEWTYPSRNHYEEPYPDIKLTLVTYIKIVKHWFEIDKRMKEDYMHNEQQKPDYILQIATENQYVLT